jgi:hypothetical protein
MTRPRRGPRCGGNAREHPDRHDPPHASRGPGRAWPRWKCWAGQSRPATAPTAPRPRASISATSHFAEQRLRHLSATRFEPLADAEFEPDNRGNLFTVLMLALILAGTVGATIWRMM